MMDYFIPRGPISMEDKQELDKFNKIMTPIIDHNMEVMRLVWMDQMIYGRGYYKTNEDGTLDYIPPHEWANTDNVIQLVNNK